MKESIKSLIPRDFWAAIYPFISRIIAPRVCYSGQEYSDRSEAFDRIYSKNLWHDPESKSGGGSTLDHTRQLRIDLPDFLRELGCESLLDAPCGDFNWMQHVQLPDGCLYLGRDIVPALIDELRAAHPLRDFGVLDIVNGPIPKVDVWMCRDVLFHLPLKDDLAVLRNMAQSQAKFFLAKNHDFVRTNADVQPGGFRYLNLRKPPFNLPRPLYRLADFNVPEPPAFLDLWSQGQIRAALNLATDATAALPVGAAVSAV